ADGRLGGLEDTDGDAGLEQTELLELLRLLEQRWRQPMKRLETGAAVAVEADVLPIDDAALAVAVEWNGEPREVERVAMHVGDHLIRRSRRHFVRRRADLEGGHLDLWLGQERPDELLDVPSRHQGLVTLDVQVHVGGAALGDLPDAI